MDRFRPRSRRHIKWKVRPEPGSVARPAHYPQVGRGNITEVSQALGIHLRLHRRVQRSSFIRHSTSTFRIPKSATSCALKCSLLLARTSRPGPRPGPRPVTTLGLHNTEHMRSKLICGVSGFATGDQSGFSWLCGRESTRSTSHILLGADNFLEGVKSQIQGGCHVGVLH
jgi:hypothetical protein